MGTGWHVGAGQGWAGERVGVVTTVEQSKACFVCVCLFCLKSLFDFPVPVCHQLLTAAMCEGFHRRVRCHRRAWCGVSGGSAQALGR